MKVVNKPDVNITLDNALLLKKYERDLRDLKQELAMHDTLSGRGRIQYNDYSPDEIRALEGKVRGFVDGETEQIEVDSIKMVHESFSILRRMIHGLQKELRERPTRGDFMAAGAQKGASAASDTEAGVQDPVPADAVGLDDEQRSGFAVGVAAPGSKPVATEAAGEGEDEGMGEEEIRVRTPRRGKAREEGQIVPEKNSAFLNWKAAQGSQYEKQFQMLKGELQGKKSKCRQTIQTLNSKKAVIDSIRVKIQQRQAEKTGQESLNLIDEEEYSLLSRQQGERQSYKSLLEVKYQLDSEIVRTEQEIQLCKTELVRSFETWFATKYADGLAALSNTKGEPQTNFGSMDTREAYDHLESNRFQGDSEAYTFYKAKRGAKVAGKKK